MHGKSVFPVRVWVRFQAKREKRGKPNIYRYACTLLLQLLKHESFEDIYKHWLKVI